MSGQPAWFDVSALEVLEPVGSEEPTNIVPVDGSFDLKVTFDGNGWTWSGMEHDGVEYQVAFYAEGRGVHAPDIDFGTETGNLTSGGGPYEVTKSSLSIDTGGLYKIACTVIFDGWPEVAGYIENILLQVVPPL